MIIQVQQQQLWSILSTSACRSHLVFKLEDLKRPDLPPSKFTNIREMTVLWETFVPVISLDPFYKLTATILCSNHGVKLPYVTPSSSIQGSIF